MEEQVNMRLKVILFFFVKEYEYHSNDKSFVKGETILAGINGLSFLGKNDLFLDQFKFNSITVDQEKTIWLGSKNNGVIIIPDLKYELYNETNSNIFDNSLFIIYPYDQNTLFLGHDNGKLSMLNEEGEITQKRINANGKIRAMAKDANGRLWIGGDRFELNIFSKELKKLKVFKKYNTIKHISMEGDNIIWLGLYSSVNKLEVAPFFQNENLEEFVWINTNTFVRENGEIIGPFPKPLSLRTYAILHTSKTSWLGTVKGIYKYENEQAMPFLENGQHVPYSVSAITQSKDSTIWVSTQAQGVLGIKNDLVIHRLNAKSGLKTNNCNTLFYDEYNNLWIGSKKGLHKLDLNTFEINVIDKYDGIPTNEISTIYARDSIVWVGTQKGLMKIPYSSIQKNKTSPPIHITNVAFWEKDTTLISFYELKYNQNNLNIEFVGITYRNRGNTNYQYRMLGVDTNWVSTTTRFARYPLLNPGEYEFQVKAINEDGVESISPAKIQLIIHQPWWQTWWFYLFTFSIGVGLIGGFFYQRFQRIRKEEQQQQEFDEKINNLRMMALQAQMNPHFVFNALSAIQKFLTTNEQEQAMI